MATITPDVGVIDIAPASINEPAANSAGLLAVSDLVQGNGFPMPKADPGAVAKFNSIFSSLVSEPTKAIKALSETMKKSANSSEVLSPTQVLSMQIDTMKSSVGINIASKFLGALSQSLKQLTTIN